MYRVWAELKLLFVFVCMSLGVCCCISGTGGSQGVIIYSFNGTGKAVVHDYV